MINLKEDKMIDVEIQMDKTIWEKELKIAGRVTLRTPAAVEEMELTPELLAEIKKAIAEGRIGEQKRSWICWPTK